MPSARSGRSTVRSRTMTRRSSSIPNRRSPSTAGAMRCGITGRPMRAIKDYNAAIELDPKYTTALIGRANAYGDKDRLAGGSERLRCRASRSIRRMRPRSTIAARHTRTRGDLDKAIEDYSAALALDPARRRLLLQSRAGVSPQGPDRSRARGLRRHNRARPQLRLCVSQPRPARACQGRFRPRHRRLHQGDRDQSEICAELCVQRHGKPAARENCARRSRTCARACVLTIGSRPQAWRWAKPM